MRVVNLSGEAHAAMTAVDPNPNGVWEGRMEAYRAAADRIKAELNAPIELSVVNKVEHDPKTDRYTATFGMSNKTLKLKITNEVAEFLATHANEAGSWRGRMEDGVLVDAYLVTY